MINWLRRLLAPPITKVELPGFSLVIDSLTHTAILYDADPETEDTRYEELEAHLKAQGYFLQVLVEAEDASSS